MMLLRRINTALAAVDAAAAAFEKLAVSTTRMKSCTAATRSSQIYNSYISITSAYHRGSRRPAGPGRSDAPCPAAAT